MTESNPFNQTSADLQGLINDVSEIIAGEPVMPGEFESHADAAAEEIAAMEGPTMSDDILKVVQKHFNNGSNGKAQETKTQHSFEKEVSRRISQAQAKARWKDH